MNSKDQKHLENLRHSSAHLLAAAVLSLWPKVKLAIGPAIDNGFYYDVDFGKQKISDGDLPEIEERMHQVLKTWDRFKKFPVTLQSVKKEFKDNPYKLELAEEFHKKGQKLTIYQSGDFRDLCGGGHVANPKKELKHFKLLKIAGAYWRGSEKNKMLTRIYGTAFATKKELDEYLTLLEKAKKSDHRKIGKELDLFTFSDLVGPGLVMWTPKGNILKKQLNNYILGINEKYGAQEVSIPHMAKISLYEISGHAEKFKNELFRVVSHYDTEFVLKPVNCPHHTQIYASRPRSYRNLPIRYVESTPQHRDEKPGELKGLQRTRSFEVEDGHTFCTPDQVKKEAINLVKTVEEFYKGLDMWGDQWISLSLRDPKSPEKYIGNDTDWEKAEKMIKEINDELKLNGKVMEGEAALYGPKIDYMRRDATGRETQLATIQIDFAMPKRFELKYIDKGGKEKTPVMIHRAILGSYERFIMALIEKYRGAFPVWLAPIQAKILPITERNLDYAKEILTKLKEEGIRTELDERSETLQAKIRDAQLEKIPYMVILGDKEEKAKKIAVRLRSGKNLGQVKLLKLLERIKAKVDSKSLSL